jgi:hypothetical protein
MRLKYKQGKDRDVVDKAYSSEEAARCLSPDTDHWDKHNRYVYTYIHMYIHTSHISIDV